MSEDGKTIGSVELNASAKLVFTVGQWKGRAFAQARKYVVTNRYQGPTPSGFSMNGAIASAVLSELRKLQTNGPPIGNDMCAVIAKNRSTKIRLGIVPPDIKEGLPEVDLREFVENESYAGPTKKGIRFPWEKLAQVIACIEVQVHALGAKIVNEPTLFPEIQPAWVTNQTTGAEREDAFAALITEPIKQFPEDFLPADGEVRATLTLPADPLQVSQKPGGKTYVSSASGFDYQVRNEVEARFVIYAQQRETTNLIVPEKMLAVFSAVAGYEKYARELRQKLIKLLQAKSHNRQLADYQASQMLLDRGLPILR